MPGIALSLLFLLQQDAVAEQKAGRDVAVEQLAGPSQHGDLAVPNVPPPRNGNPAQMSQLPPTLEAPRESSKGEGTLAKGDEDRRNLAGEVARAAEMLRQRGQQPTPEALAREIGPDALAAYLNQDPSALDVYSAPREQESAPMQQDGGAAGPVVILPGPNGG